MNKILLIGALATTALVGCSSQGDTPDVPGNGTDVHFLAMMTPHHQQAVDMSEIILAKSDVSPQTKDLAERIKVGQQEEIDYMTNLASQWGQSKAMEVHSTHIANGMITPDQLEKLKSLEGEGAEDTFLTLMHSHHEGAVAMT